MSFNSLTTFSLSSSFVAQSNSFIKVLKFLLLLYYLNSWSSTSLIYSSNMFSFSSFFLFVCCFLVLVLGSLFFAFLFSSFDDTVSPFSFSFFWLSDFSVSSVKIVSNKLLNKFNNSFCPGVCLLFIISAFFILFNAFMHLNLF